MAKYDDYKQLVLPLNVIKNKLTSALGGRGSTITAGPGNEGIDLAIWFEERVLDGTITVSTINTDALINLTGLPPGSSTLGTFTGSIISDNTTIVDALQELETYIETFSGGDGIYGGSGNIPGGAIATQSGTFTIDTTAQAGFHLKFGGVTGVPTNRYGVSITDNLVALGNVFGTQNQGLVVLNSNGFSANGSSGNNLSLFSNGGGQLALTSVFTILDAAGNGGLRNNADYSANFVPLSLVTKQYVDGLLTNPLVTGDGLTGDGTLGDPLAWAGAFTASPLTGSGTTFFPITLANNSITSAHIQNGAILFQDWNQNGAISGQVPQWTGSAWVATSISGSLPSGSLGDILLYNGTAFAPASEITETITGVTGTTISLASTPLSYGKLMVFRNGVYLIVTDDFTRSGTVITFGQSLISTDKITAIYYI